MMKQQMFTESESFIESERGSSCKHPRRLGHETWLVAMQMQMKNRTDTLNLVDNVRRPFRTHLLMKGKLRFSILLKAGKAYYYISVQNFSITYNQ